MKRPHEEDPDHNGDSNRVKRVHRKTHRVAYQQQGLASLIDHPQDETVIEEQLSRAIVIALRGVGFEAAQSQALEAFRAQAQEYMVRFATRIKRSMQHSRRSAPVAHDFAYSLTQTGLRPAVLLDELEYRLPPQAIQIPILQPVDNVDSETFVPQHIPLALESAGSLQRAYVPKHFPILPSPHAYKDTPVYTSRETDPLKIRERATQEGVLAEQALRKLMAASKTGRDSGRRLGAPERWNKEEAVYQDAMNALLQMDNKIGDVMDSGVFDMDSSMGSDMNQDDLRSTAMVNSDRAFWRSGMTSTAHII